MKNMENYFKTEVELQVYLANDVPDSEYTGAFKSKGGLRKYFQYQGLPIEDQEFIDSSFLGSYNKDYTNTSDNVSGSVNGTYKNGDNTWLNPSKLVVIACLEKTRSYTPEI